MCLYGFEQLVDDKSAAGYQIDLSLLQVDCYPQTGMLQVVLFSNKFAAHRLQEA